MRPATKGLLVAPVAALVRLPLAEVDYSALPEGIPPILSYAAKWVETSAEYQKTSVICPARVEPGPGRGFFDRTLIGVGIAGGADDSGGVKWENAELERAKRVFGTDGGTPATVNSTARPPGSTNGNQCPRSP